MTRIRGIHRSVRFTPKPLRAFVLLFRERVGFVWLGGFVDVVVCWYSCQKHPWHHYTAVASFTCLSSSVRLGLAIVVVVVLLLPPSPILVLVRALSVTVSRSCADDVVVVVVVNAAAHCHAVVVFVLSIRNMGKR
jgi:hypothetical protein